MKYLKLPKARQLEILKQIKEQLEGEWTEKIVFTLPTPPEGIPKPTIKMSPEVWNRILAYVDTTATEIAWNGCVIRTKNVFEITKVFLYPQTVSGGTVVVDNGTEEYGPYDRWVDAMDPETYNTMRFQGHSHVNFDVRPSSTDTDAEAKRVRNLEDGEFYIFMIINKKREQRWVIYDKMTHILFENDDIIIDNGMNALNESVEEEKEQFLTFQGYNAEASIFWLPETSNLVTKYKLKTSPIWKQVPGQGYVKCHQLDKGEKLSGKMRRRIVAAGGQFIQDEAPKTYNAGYSGYTYGGTFYGGSNGTHLAEKPTPPASPYPGAYGGTPDGESDVGADLTDDEVIPPPAEEEAPKEPAAAAGTMVYSEGTNDDDDLEIEQRFPLLASRK